MSSFFNLTLDTTAPAGVSLSINSGAAYATAQLVTCAISTSDVSTVGYQMKIWGDVDPTYDTNVQATAGASTWFSYSPSYVAKLSAGDGSKTLNIEIEDNVYNISSPVTASITLDTVVPVSTVTVGPDVSIVSKQSGKNTCSFSFQCNVIFQAYKVMVVTSSSSIQSAGTLILTTNGSVNMSGAAGSYPATTNIACQINGTDLQVASGGDGTKIVKVFVQDVPGNWSTA
jgi:hypothetical protein